MEKILDTQDKIIQEYKKLEKLTPTIKRHQKHDKPSSMLLYIEDEKTLYIPQCNGIIKYIEITNPKYYLENLMDLIVSTGDISGNNIRKTKALVSVNENGIRIYDSENGDHVDMRNELDEIISMNKKIENYRDRTIESCALRYKFTPEQLQSLQDKNLLLHTINYDDNSITMSINRSIFGNELKKTNEIYFDVLEYASDMSIILFRQEYDDMNIFSVVGFLNV